MKDARFEWEGGHMTVVSPKGEDADGSAVVTVVVGDAQVMRGLTHAEVDELRDALGPKREGIYTVLRGEPPDTTEHLRRAEAEVERLRLGLCVSLPSRCQVLAQALAAGPITLDPYDVKDDDSARALFVELILAVNKNGAELARLRGA